MPIPSRGHKSYLAYGREANWGTLATITHKTEVISANFTPSIGVIRDPSLYDAVSRRGLYKGGQLWRFSFVTRGNYAGIMLLIDGVFGTATFGANGGATTGSGPYTHTFKEGANLNSYSMEFVQDVPSGKGFIVQGAIITGLVIRGVAGQGDDAMLQFEWTGLAKDMISNDDPTVLANYPPVLPILYHQGTTVDTGLLATETAANIRLRNFEFKLENPVHDDRFYVGAVNIDQPIRSNFIAPTWRFTTEFVTRDMYDAARAFGAVTPKLIFSDGTNSFQIRTNSAVITEFSAPVENYGITLATVSAEAFRDPTDLSAAVCVMVNNQATIVVAN